MKILFVYTDVNVMSVGARSYHFGLGILSAVLKKNNHQTELYYMYNKFDTVPLVKKIALFKPDILAFTADSTQFVHVKKILSQIKNQGIFTVLGGPHPSLCPSCLAETDGLDAICVGEGEMALLELANTPTSRNIKNMHFKVPGGPVIVTTTRPFITDLDSLPFADRQIFDYQKIINSDFGRASFMLSRGCPYNCTFCASPAMGRLQDGKYVRLMSVERAISELEYLKSQYNFKSIFFADDIFTIDKNYVQKFAELYTKRINIPFEANSRVETASLDIFKILKAAGCFKIHMGIESGNQDFRNKVLNRLMTNEQIISAFAMCRQAGLLSKSYNIVGFPCETKKIHESTVELNKVIRPDGHVCYIFQPYPGTKLYELSIEKGFISPGSLDKGVVSRRDSVLNMPDFPHDEIIKCQHNFSYQIYKSSSLFKSLVYRIYYSCFGEFLLKLLNPVNPIIRKILKV